MHIKANQLMTFGNRQQLARINERNTKKIQRKKNFTKKGGNFIILGGQICNKNKNVS